MPARAALRVIQIENENPRIDCRREEAVLGAYQVLADAMGATIETTSDGQVILYTGYFKPSLQVEPRIIYAREPTDEDDAPAPDSFPFTELVDITDDELKAFKFNV